MLKGDLLSTPLPAVLRQLADGVASGCLHVLDGIGEEAKVYLRGGQVYAVHVPGHRPQLGARLVSSGSLGPEGLAEALEAQRTELQGWRLGELLVHLGYVDQPVVEAFINEQVREQTSDLMRWPTGTWKFRVNERTREDVAPPTPVEALLEEVSQRMAEWQVITETVHGPDAVPVLSAAGQSDAEMSIDPEAWSLLCKVDGTRSIAALARECGFTLYEAGQVVYTLVRSGLLEVEEVLVGAEQDAPTGSVASRLFAAFAPEVTIPAQAEEPSASEVASLITRTLREDRTAADLVAPQQDEIDGSIDRVSAALSALIGTTTDESLFDAPKARTPKVKPLTPAEAERAAKKAEKVARDALRREQDSAELVAAQAELEAARAAQDAEYGADHEAEIVNLSEVRREAARRDEQEAAEAQRHAEKAAAKKAKQAEQAEQAEAARVAEEAARVAEEQARVDEEAARLAQEQADAEAARVAEEEARLAAAEAAELARLAQEQADAEAARLAEEEARLAQEQADAEAARLAEEEARLAAAEAAELARVAEERAAAEAEQARVAEEAAEQVAALERAQAEEELRQAAREQAAAQAAAEQAAAEQAKAARRLAEQEAADAEHHEQVRATAQRANASTAFAELSAAAASSSDVQVLEAEAPVEQVEEEPLPTYGSSDTDMASLFRELSSLGMEDEPTPPPSRPSASPPRPPTASVPAKKKKGLFGR